MSNRISKPKTPSYKKNSIYLVPVVCSIWLFSGCAFFSDSANGRYIDPFDGYAKYAESVFIRQNEVTSEIMMLPEDEFDPYEYESLLDTEKEMQDACELLNEYAIREVEGQSIGLFFKRRVQNSVEGCESAIRNVETSLAKLNSDGNAGQE